MDYYSGTALGFTLFVFDLIVYVYLVTCVTVGFFASLSFFYYIVGFVGLICLVCFFVLLLMYVFVIGFFVLASGINVFDALTSLIFRSLASMSSAPTFTTSTLRRTSRICAHCSSSSSRTSQVRRRPFTGQSPHCSSPLYHTMRSNVFMDLPIFSSGAVLLMVSPSWYLLDVHPPFIPLSVGVLVLSFALGLC